MDRSSKMKLRSQISQVDQYLTHKRVSRSLVVWCQSMMCTSKYVKN